MAVIVVRSSDEGCPFRVFYRGCTTDFAADQPQKTPDDTAKLTNSRINSTKNKGGNGNSRVQNLDGFGR